MHMQEQVATATVRLIRSGGSPLDLYPRNSGGSLCVTGSSFQTDIAQSVTNNSDGIMFSIFWEEGHAANVY